MFSTSLFRFGFLCFHKGEKQPSEVPPGWVTTHLGDDLVVLSHPEARLTSLRGGGLIIGEWFSTGAMPDEIAAASTEGGFHSLLDDLSGRFAFIVKRGSGWRVYHDAVGARSIFYKVEGEFAASSHSGLLAEAFGIGRDETTAELMTEPAFRKRGVTALPGDISPFAGVYALVPNSYLDINKRKTVRYWPRQARGRATFDEFAEEYDTYFHAFSKFGFPGYTFVLGVTPGIDSRALIAAFKSFGRGMRYVTWLDYALPEDDVPIAQKLVQYLGGEHTFMKARAKEASDDFRTIAEVSDLNCQHGRRASVMTANMHKNFGGDRNAFIRGYGGEIIRGFYNLHPKSTIKSNTAEEFARAYGPRENKFEWSSEYRNIVTQAKEDFRKRGNYADIEKYGFDISDIFYWEQRMGMWGAAMHNEMDAALFSLTGFNSRRLFETAYGLSNEDRLSKDLLLKLTRRYDEGLAAIPVA